MEKFFSVNYAGRADLFEGLEIWKGKIPDGDQSLSEDYKYRKLQGTYPVIFLSFADVKETNFQDAGKRLLWRLMNRLYTISLR